jgi:hypothetical protein
MTRTTQGETAACTPLTSTSVHVLTTVTKAATFLAGPNGTNPSAIFALAREDPEGVNRAIVAFVRGPGPWPSGGHTLPS